MTQVGNRGTVGALVHLHALTGVHWGAGASLGTVDLPIQRERHTDWPNGAGSALKGVLRDACREALVADGSCADRATADSDRRIGRLFGSAKASGEDSNAGALCVTDVRLLALPVRSLKGVFAWISCPAVLARLQRDAKLAGNPMPEAAHKVIKDIPFEVDSPNADDRENNNTKRIEKALVADGCPLVVADTYLQFDDETLQVVEPRVTELAEWLSRNCLPGGDDYQATRQRLAKQFVVVPDNVFTHFCKYATEVVARIGLDYATKTVKDGALFYQELLPAESLMYAVALVNDSRAKAATDAGRQLLDDLVSLLADSSLLQVGGDETTGKGFCSIHINQGTSQS